MKSMKTLFKEKAKINRTLFYFLQMSIYSNTNFLTKFKIVQIEIHWFIQ